jgi:hypothetical protein
MVAASLRRDAEARPIHPTHCHCDECRTADEREAQDR